MAWEEKLNQTSLVDILVDYEKEDLKEIAKEKGVTGTSNCNKNTLVKKLAAHMLKPDVMRSYFLCLQDEEIEEFEKAIKVSGFYETEKGERLVGLYETSYIGMLLDGRIMIPKDVIAVYNSFQGKDFEEERKKVSFLFCCLQTISILYGIAPFSVLMKLMAQNTSLHMTEEEIKSAIAKLPEEKQNYVLEKDTIYHEDLYPDDRGLLNLQQGKEFYIPSLMEIRNFGTKGFDPNNKEAKKLKQFLIQKMGAMSDEAEFACGVIQIQIIGDCQMQNIFEVFDDLGLVLENENHLEELINCINNLWNNTRMLLNRGYTPNELAKIERKQMQSLPLRDNVIDFAQAKMNKIYPNDPCPCGSGKKYKNCCKNKK